MENKNNLQEKFTQFKNKNGKKIVVGLLIAVILIGSGAFIKKYTMHQRRNEQHQKEVQAESELIINTAKEKKISLIGEAKAKQTILKNMNGTASDTTFDSVFVTTLQDDRFENEGRKHEDKKASNEHAEEISHNHAPVEDSSHINNSSTTTTSTATTTESFVPVYKIRATKNNVIYRFTVNAITSEILSSRVGK